MNFTDHDIVDFLVSPILRSATRTHMEHLKVSAYLSLNVGVILNLPSIMF